MKIVPVFDLESKLSNVFPIEKSLVSDARYSNQNISKNTDLLHLPIADLMNETQSTNSEGLDFDYREEHLLYVF